MKIRELKLGIFPLMANLIQNSSVIISSIYKWYKIEGICLFTAGISLNLLIVKSARDPNKW